jgi:hypothetical protein
LQKKKLTLKVKDSAIKIKLEIAKLQSDIPRGDVDVTVKERSETGSVLDGLTQLERCLKTKK